MRFKSLTYKLLCLSWIISFLLNSATGFAYYIWSPESGKFVSSESQSQDYADELFQQAASYQKQNKVDRAIEEFQNLLRKYPTAPNASEAQYQIGLIFEERKDYDKAVEAYKKVTENYPQSDRADAVTERLFKIANLYMTGEKAKLMGLSIKSGLPKAIDIFEHIVRTAPYSTYGDQAQFNAGLTYKKMGQFQTAMEAFQKLTDQYPNSTLLDDARYQVAETSFEYSKRATRDEKAIDQAIEKISDFLAHYPQSNVSDKINALKQEIANRDAEKNYQIGVYYENEKQLESAALYYEDVTIRHPETPYGKLAAQKIQSLKEPLEKLKREQREMALEMESVGAKLKSLRSEQGQSASDESRSKQLEEQMTSLKRQQEYLFQDQLKSIEDREKAWRQADKGWHEKWKAFQGKRKDMRSNQAPELASAFERWEKSLLEEKDRLAKERATIASLRYELKIEPEPKVRKAKKSKSDSPAPTQVQTQKGKPWWQAIRISRGEKKGEFESLNQKIGEIQKERDQLFKTRAEKERQLDRSASELIGLEAQNLELSLQEPWFVELLDQQKPELKQAEKKLNYHQIVLNRLVREYEIKKALHMRQYGPLDSDKWSLSFSENASDARALIASGVDVDQALRDLQQRKARLSDEWTGQKAKVETISNAFNVKSGALPKSEQPVVKMSAEEAAKKASQNTSQAELEEVSSAQKLQDASPRILKKRIKFLEREIRQRFDEIGDWNARKDQSIEELNRLIQEQKPFPRLTKATNALTSPLRGFLWLARSLTFGLSNVDRRVVKQAKRQSDASDNESSSRIRQLHEQIELESLLIQGRVAEINQYESELAELKKIAHDKEVELIPIYTERDFAIGKESLASANRIVSSEDRNILLIEQLNRETKKLQSVESELTLIDRKIEKINQAKKVSSSDNAARTAQSKSESDDFETEPVSASKSEPTQEQLKSEAELGTLKKKIERLAQRLQTKKQLHREALKKFYLESQAKSEQSSHESRQAQQTHAKLKSEIEKLTRSENNLLRSEEKMWLRKKELIESKMSRMRSDSQAQEKAVLISELEATQMELAAVRESLSRSKES